MPEMKKERVDRLIVDQGLAVSRSQAHAFIMAGQVCLGDRLIQKPSETFEPGTVFRLKEGAQLKYVSRGGEKLEGALNESELNVTGFKALDIGISTGGFTDCLLQNGVTSVIGLDVGHNQLSWKIKNDARVQAHEGVNARAIPPELVPEKVDLVVIDVSFISLRLILPEAKKYLKSQGYLLALIKPQFEVERGQVGKGGIVKDLLLHEQVQEKIRTLSEGLGFSVKKIFPSPIKGTDGNTEFFIFSTAP